MELSDGHILLLAGERGGAGTPAPLLLPSAARAASTPEGLKPVGSVAAPSLLGVALVEVPALGEFTRARNSAVLAGCSRLTPGAWVCLPTLTHMRCWCPGTTCCAQSTTHGTKCPKCKTSVGHSVHQDVEVGPTRTQPVLQFQSSPEPADSFFLKKLFLNSQGGPIPLLLHQHKRERVQRALLFSCLFCLPLYLC